MLKFVVATFVVLLSTSAYAQDDITTRLEADGVSDTYELINSVLAPGYDAVETPDCAHGDFGQHITQEFEEELGQFVFRFILHVDPDFDCDNDLEDRQRSEIKTYDESPCYLVGYDGETHEYTWRFKIDEGFQPSTAFTHIHQLKVVGGDLDSRPIVSITLRADDEDGDRWELQTTDEDDEQNPVAMNTLDDMKGKWVSVTETVTYGEDGYIRFTMCNDDGCFCDYEEERRMWKDGVNFVRPKWGFYRSLEESDYLRDEYIDYAYFQIIGPDSECQDFGDTDDK